MKRKLDKGRLGWRRVVGAMTTAWWSAHLASAEPVVSNVTARQVPGRMEVEIGYDVSSTVWNQVAVEVQLLEVPGKSWVLVTQGLSGDVGPAVITGERRLVRWRPDLSWAGWSRRQIAFQVEAREKQLIPGMVPIKPGTFTMGSPAFEASRDDDEGPLTEVTLSRRYWLGQHEVTQAEWESVMGNNPSQFNGEPDLPVETVSWTEAIEYCRRLTQREREAGRLPEGYEYRLPTEAEWEYACRAGSKTATVFGNELVSTRANFNGNYPYNSTSKGPYLRKTAKVGNYAANAWGLYDMHGNVCEWCLDWYEGKLPGGAVTDPSGPKMGSIRVNRGGSWSTGGRVCRSAVRRGYSPSYRFYNLGFRVACAPVVQ